MPTVISGTTLNALTTVSWGVMSLFANNEQGVWFDPSDLNNYMSGLGPELVTNGTFNSNTTGWTTHNAPTVSIDSQRVKIIGTGGSSSIYQDVTLDVSKSYEIKGVITTDATSAQTCSISLREGGAGAFSSISGYSDVSAAAGTSANARWVLSGRSVVRIFLVAGYAASGGIAYFDDISVKELTTISSATMFQNAAGTTPVTAVEQPVGLILDKSKGLALGAEIAVNGSFASGTGWTGQAGWAFSGGTANGTAVSGYLYQGNASIVVNRYYEVTFTVSNYVSGSVRAYLGATPTLGTSVSANGTYTQRFSPTINGNELGVLGSAFTGSIDNVSVKEVAGNHARQSTDASRPVLSARVNQVEYSEQFDNAYWTKDNFTVANTTATTDPLGGTTADVCTPTAVGAQHRIYKSGTVQVTATSCTYSLSVKANGYTKIGIRESAISGAGAAFDLSGTGSVIGAFNAGGSTVSGMSITATGNSWFRIVLTISFASATAQTLGVHALSPSYTAGSTIFESWLPNGTDGYYIWGADLRVTNVGTNLPPYQRVGAAITGTTNPAVTGVPDYDTNGFPLYLRFDGVDDSLSTNSIDFTATDKMSVFAGVRKLSDVGAGVIAELSNDAGGNNGAFNILASTSIGDGARRTWGGQLRGTVNNSFGGPTYVSPISGVITQKLDIAGAAAANEIIQLVNGSATTLTFLSADSGTGNFGNYPLYVGRRNNDSFPYNGHLYNLIIRGALSNSVDITNTEAYINSKTKAY